jgi:hypothetical protein
MMKATIVCVLGMHRSGTSLIAGTLSFMGVYLGPEPSLMNRPNMYNRKGFWEHRDFVHINEEILSRLGGRWYRPPGFGRNWESALEIEDLRRRAGAVIQQQFGSADVWGWKDPRTCLTLPFWQQLLPRMRYVICLRNPVDIAMSLHDRNGLSMVEGIALWLTYTRSSLQHTADEERHLFSYEQFVEHWPGELQRLADFIGRPEWAGRPAVQDAVRHFVDRDLQHYRSSELEAVDEAALGIPTQGLRMVREIYASLKQGEVPQAEIVQRLDDALDAVGREPWKGRKNALTRYWKVLRSR